MFAENFFVVKSQRKAARKASEHRMINIDCVEAREMFLRFALLSVSFGTKQKQKKDSVENGQKKAHWGQ